MVRTVKTKQVRSLAKGQTALLLPGSTAAEPWELWALHGKAPADLIQVFSSTLDNRLRKSTTLGLPVSQVFCVPLWLNETNTAQFAGMIPLQLELRGLQPRGADAAVFDWTVVAQEAGRTLVMVGVLPGTLSSDLHAEAYESFDLSARYLPFPADAMTIWREQDRLAFALTRGENLVYFQMLAEGQISARVVQDLSCAQATLGMHDIVGAVQRVVLWTEIGAEELATLQTALKIPIDQEERPAPVAPVQAWKLTPAIVGEARRARANQKWQIRGIALFAILYLALVALMISRFVMLSLHVDQLQKWNATNSDALALVGSGRAAWKDLAPVVDTKDYPLNLLLQADQSIPTDQLHLTLFETGDGHLLIKGEAKNVAGAFQFLSKLKSDPYFAAYNLDMGNPRPLPNDLAQFQIEGNHAGN